MRIALLAPLLPRTAHSELSSSELLHQLVGALRARQVEAVLYGAGAGSLVRAPREVVEPAPDALERPLESAWESLHLTRFFEAAGDFDIVYNHAGAQALSYSELLPVPLVTTLAGPIPAELLPVYRAFSRRTLFVAASDSGRLPELEYVATIPPGVDLARLPFGAAPENLLSFIAPIRPRTGAAEAIAVARGLGCRLVMLGAVEDHDYYRTQVAPHLVPGQVVLDSDTSPARRAALLGSARAHLHPVDYEEPFNTVPLEAMACGAPVVAFRRGALAEIVLDGETGFLVDGAEEAVERLLKRGSIERERCRAWVAERYSLDRMAESVMELTELVLADHRPHARTGNPPWGHWEVLLDEPGYKVKRIRVNPGARLSYQRHARRAEHWMIVAGSGVVTLDGRELELKAGETVDVARGAAHRVANPGSEPLVFIEIQAGDYFGEDDIERLSDDYGRR